MKQLRFKPLAILLAMCSVILLIAVSCGDDGSPQEPEDDIKPSTDPIGQWSVTSSNVQVEVVNSDLPSEVQAYVEEWLKDLISNGGSNEWNVAQAAILLTKVESPACVPMVYAYDSANRSCTVTTPIDLQDIDVSSLNLCQTVGQPPAQAEYCITTISITADVTPDLQWAEDFNSLGGTEAIGSVQKPAQVDVTISGPIIGGTYNVDFYSSRTVSGKRCSGCANCPVPPAPALDGPNGFWDVTSTNADVTVVDTNVPTVLQPYMEEWLRDLISNGGTSEWDVIQFTALLTRTETEMCVPAPYVYDPFNRRCTTTTPIDVQDVDVSFLNLCYTEGVPPVQVTYCITKISIDADLTPDLQWTASFDAFNGTEDIGSAQSPAGVTVTVEGPVIGGVYDVTFYSSRNVSGTRCSGCTPCQ
jgi:hypothetical protein